MGIEFILVAFATLWAWETLRGVLPFTVNIRLAPALVAALAYGLTYLPGRVILACACAGAVAILRVLAKAKPIDPWVFPVRKISLTPGTRGKPPSPGVGRRIPRL